MWIWILFITICAFSTIFLFLYYFHVIIFVTSGKLTLIDNFYSCISKLELILIFFKHISGILEVSLFVFYYFCSFIGGFPLIFFFFINSGSNLFILLLNQSVRWRILPSTELSTRKKTCKSSILIEFIYFLLKFSIIVNCFLLFLFQLSIVEFTNFLFFSHIFMPTNYNISLLYLFLLLFTLFLQNIDILCKFIVIYD